ncbi:MAG: hypothetical protein M3440_14665, partial [Chloroflexota bacterium]|nr:hypothetical protein [Chloroflexota bacterium]
QIGKLVLLDRTGRENGIRAEEDAIEHEALLVQGMTRQCNDSHIDAKNVIGSRINDRVDIAGFRLKESVLQIVKRISAPVKQRRLDLGMLDYAGLEIGSMDHCTGPLFDKCMGAEVVGMAVRCDDCHHFRIELVLYRTEYLSGDRVIQPGIDNHHVVCVDSYHPDIGSTWDIANLIRYCLVHLFSTSGQRDLALY